MFRSNVPKYFIINSKILMTDSISKSIHFFPGNIRIFFLYAFRYILAGFSNNFEISDNSVNCLVVPFEMLEVKTNNIFLNSLHG